MTFTATGQLPTGLSIGSIVVNLCMRARASRQRTRSPGGIHGHTHDTIRPEDAPANHKLGVSSAPGRRSTRYGDCLPFRELARRRDLRAPSNRNASGPDTPPPPPPTHSAAAATSLLKRGSFRVTSTAVTTPHVTLARDHEPCRPCLRSYTAPAYPPDRCLSRARVQFTDGNNIQQNRLVDETIFRVKKHVE